MKDNGGRSRDEILAEVESVRSDMDSTLSQIERKLTPGQMVDQGLAYLRSSGANEFLSNLGTSVKQNPLPIALTGVCIAWLMAAGRTGNAGMQAGAAGTSFRRASDRAWSSARDQAGRAGKTLSDAAQAAREHASRAGRTLSDAAQAARDTYDQAKESLSGTAQYAREGLSRGADLAQRQFERARGGYDWMMREQPLALAAIGIAVGALLAAAAPRTEAEDEWMGEASDRLAGQAKEAGREQLERASGRVGSAVAEETRQPDGTARGVGNPGTSTTAQPPSGSSTEWPSGRPPGE